MNTELIKKTKWFWAWQDEQEETWLSEMANEGLHLDKVTFPGSYQFKKGASANYIYRLDYQSLKAKDRESYLQLFADSGWELVGEMAGWMYFRFLPGEGKIPEIYSDTESKIEKYQRLILYLVVFLPIMVTVLPSILGRVGIFSSIADVLFALLMLLYGFSMFSLVRRINELKKNSN